MVVQQEIQIKSGKSCLKMTTPQLCVEGSFEWENQPTGTSLTKNPTLNQPSWLPNYSGSIILLVVGIVVPIQRVSYVPTVFVTRSTNSIVTNWAHPWAEAIAIAETRKLGARHHVVRCTSAMLPRRHFYSIQLPERRPLSTVSIECKPNKLIHCLPACFYFNDSHLQS